MPIAHMKNLGTDMRHKNLAENVAALRKIPIGFLLEQVLKVMNQVKIFVDNGFIHGDIRPPNMMIIPDTGIITIIDFDLFEEIRYFMAGNVAFYNRPPENYIHDFFRDPYSLLTLDQIDKAVTIKESRELDAAPYVEMTKQHLAHVLETIPPPYHASLEAHITAVNGLSPDVPIPFGINTESMAYLRDLFSREANGFKKRIIGHDSIKRKYLVGEYNKAAKAINDEPNPYRQHRQKGIFNRINIQTQYYNLDHYIRYNNDHEYLADKLTLEKLLDILESNRKYFVDKYIVGAGLSIDDITERQIHTKWNEMIVPYFDGFGLAVSLLELLAVAKYDDAHILNLRDNVLMKMAAWKLEDRIDIVEAIKRTEAIIAEAKPKAAAAASVNNAVAAAVAAAKAALAAKAVKPAAAASVNNAVAAARAALAAKAGKAGGRRKTRRRQLHKRSRRAHTKRHTRSH